jgi:hypothetical protein
LQVYGNLYKESVRAMTDLRSEGLDVPGYVKMARKIFYGRKQSHEFTGLSWMFIRDVVNASKCLNFMIQQQTVYNLLYNMHFSVTLNTNEASSFIVLAGPSETGKSWAMKKLSSGIAASLSRTEDSHSDQAGTIDDSGDLQVSASLRCVFEACSVASQCIVGKGYTGACSMVRTVPHPSWDRMTCGRPVLMCSVVPFPNTQIVIEDEYKDTTDGKDASSDSRIKTKQSQMSNGVSIRRRYHRNMKTDKAEIEVGVGIERSFLWTGTNNPQKIPLAMLNRAIVIPVVLPNSRLHRDKIAENMTGGVAAAIYNNAKVQKNFKAAQMSSKVLSSLQVHYTALQAIGGIPSMIEDCFELFKILYVKTFGEGKKKKGKKGDVDVDSSRQTVEHLRLATSIHIRDHLAIWYCRGLGEHFGYDKGIEGLWYAWSNYLRMEEVVLAMSQIESTRSMTGYVTEVMILLKESIMVTDGEMFEMGDYWVTKYTRRDAILRDLRTRLIRFGTGLCEKVYEIVEHSKTDDNQNIKMDKIPDRPNE